MSTVPSVDAILLPADGRNISTVSLMLSTAHPGIHRSIRRHVPHPEVHMDFVAEGAHVKAWDHIIVEWLDGMNRKFSSPYVIFFPTISRDGMAFPINKVIQDMQGPRFNPNNAWRGNIVIAKYKDDQFPFDFLVDASMSDYPIIKNHFLNYGPHGPLRSYRA
ncbi:hypothetical protein D9619_001067 [Psilocybe cf. subviscida]|uniref:Uncharacterized protein n=1 Tax=Psilocybe cf. subviscida TaxID=2480587 RepID=A0A8H5F3P1_9AGAR|nr:hypothetical protein D9619_001067 [Psilocybe cf. subviscida]